MTVTALVILLSVIAVAARTATAVQQVLIARRGLLGRLVIATAGLGYGLAEPLRGTGAGMCLTALGGWAAASLAADARRRALGRVVGVATVRPLVSEPAAAAGLTRTRDPELGAHQPVRGHRCWRARNPS